MRHIQVLFIVIEHLIGWELPSVIYKLQTFLGIKSTAESTYSYTQLIIYLYFIRYYRVLNSSIGRNQELCE